MLRIKKQLLILPLRIAILAALLIASLYSNAPLASADQISGRRIDLSSSDINAVNVTHQFTFTIKTATSTGSVVFEYCTNSPLLEFPCSVPTGLDSAGALLIAQSGETGFSVHGDTALTSNRIVLTRTPTGATSQQVSYSLSGITNPDVPGTYFVRISTYASDDGSGTVIDRGGVAFHTSEEYSLQLFVPPWLEFCVGITISSDCSSASGNYLDLGDFSPGAPSAATSQFKANTNADNGYNVSVYGTTLTSGNNVIEENTSPSVSLSGVNQFGINLTDNSVPNVGQNPSGPGIATVHTDYDNFNLFHFISGDTLATAPGPSDNVTFTVSYLVNIKSDQAPGIYNTSISYVCLATF